MEKHEEKNPEMMTAEKDEGEDENERRMAKE
jgi:hypothetical protein